MKTFTIDIENCWTATANKLKEAAKAGKDAIAALRRFKIVINF